eukprot:gene38995-51285_t
MSDVPQLALVTPLVTDPADFLPLLDAALKGGRVASVHLRIASTDENVLKRCIHALGTVIQEQDAALLIDPPADWRNVARWGADGVHLPRPELISEALQALKPD